MKVLKNIKRELNKIKFIFDVILFEKRILQKPVTYDTNYRFFRVRKYHKLKLAHINYLLEEPFSEESIAKNY